jgi:transcriptional regulator GlxA family with amidase domain
VYAALENLLKDQPWPADPNPVSPALQHIESNLGTLMTNAQLAGLCHFSEDYFVRLFRQHLGQTPAQYILERRIATATNQLAFTTDSIEQIATQLGFANRYHFTKMFTRRMRISPAAYRNQARV